MKKFMIVLAFMLAYAGYTHSQMIEDFEHIPLNIMFGGENDNSAMTVIGNPDLDEANPSQYVIEFFRSKHGVPWGGFWSLLPEPVDMTNMKYVHVQVWKPRISPIRFKVEGGPGGTYEFESLGPQTLTEAWETITFYFPYADGEYPVIVFMPDFEDPLVLVEDIIIYFDNIIFSDNEEPGEGNELMIENFSPIHMNLMAGGEDDDSYFDVVFNPYQNEANPSHRVGKFFRSQHGLPWGGFWSAIPEPFDMSEHKYVYVDVWKSRISPVKFKVEGGPGGTFEFESMQPQTQVYEWETLVFHFPDADGEYPVIAFMPDFEDPLELDEDIIIYFDNIRLGGEPNVFEVTFHVDIADAVMNGQLYGFDPDEHHILISGSLLGWAEPGTDPDQVMEPHADNPMVYVATFQLEAGTYEYKYFSDLIGEGWDGGEWAGDPNRVVEVTNHMVVEDVFEAGDPPTFTVTFDIIDNEGEPIENATIMFNSIINEMGDYTFTDITAGIYEYIINAPGFIEVSDEAEVTEEMMIEVVMEEETEPNVIETEDISLKIYPNPVRGNLYIEADSEIKSVQMVDMLGQVVYSSVVNNLIYEMNISGLTDGIYLVQIMTQNGLITHRIQLAK